MKRLLSILLILGLLVCAGPSWSMLELIQNGASTPIPFLLVDSTTGQTGQTGESGTAAIRVYYGSTSAASGGTITEIDSTHMPGDYTYTPTATETGTNGPLILHITCTGCMTVDVAVEIVAFNPMSATNLGLSALPTASPAASGGLPTVGIGSGQITPDGFGNVYVSHGTGTGQLNLSSGNVGVQSGTGANQINLSSGNVALQANQAVNASQFGGHTVTLDSNNLPETDPYYFKGQAVTLDSNNVPYVDTEYWGNATLPTIPTAAANGTAAAGDILSNPSNLLVTDSNGGAKVYSGTGTDEINLSSGNLAGSVASVTGAVGSVTGAVGSVTGNVGGNVVGSVASVTGAVGSVTAGVNASQIGGHTAMLDSNNLLEVDTYYWGGTSTGATLPYAGTPPTASANAAAVWAYTIDGSLKAIDWGYLSIAQLVGTYAVTYGSGTQTSVYKNQESTTADTSTVTTNGSGQPTARSTTQSNLP